MDIHLLANSWLNRVKNLCVDCLLFEINLLFPKTLECFYITAYKIKFLIKDCFGKCDQIFRKLRVWSHLLKNSLMKNLIFCAAYHLDIFCYLEHYFDSFTRLGRSLACADYQFQKNGNILEC